MAGKPWEKFQKQKEAPAEDGPWNKFKSSGEPVDLLKKFNEKGYETATPGFFKDMLNFGTGTADEVSLGNLRYSKKFRDELANAETESPSSVRAGRALGLAGLTGASLMLPGGIPAMVAGGAAQGVLTKPDEAVNLTEDLGKRVRGALVGGGAALALGGAGKGLKKGADIVMQKAVGRTKYTPGTGSELIKAGVGGTRGKMKNQVKNKKDEVFQEMLQATTGAPQVVSSQPVADSVRRVGNKMRVPGGAPAAADQPALDLIDTQAQDIASRSLETPYQMLRRRRAAGNRAFNNVTDLEKRSLMGQISKEEQKAYSQILKKEVPELIPLDQRYSALAKAASALNKDAPIYQGMGLPGLAVKSVAGGAGYAAGGPGGALAAMALTTPLGQSIAAHLASGGAKAIPYASPVMINELVRRAMENE